MTIPGIPAGQAGVFISPADTEGRISPAEHITCRPPLFHRYDPERVGREKPPAKSADHDLKGA